MWVFDFFFFLKGLEEELFGWAVSPLAFLSLYRAGFASWLSWQQLDGELKLRKGLGAAKEEPPQLCPGFPGAGCQSPTCI